MQKLAYLNSFTNGKSVGNNLYVNNIDCTLKNIKFYNFSFLHYYYLFLSKLGSSFLLKSIIKPWDIFKKSKKNINILHGCLYT